MRKVIVETVGKGTRTIKVGIDWSKVVLKPNQPKKSAGIMHSPLTGRMSSENETCASRCWKTTKRGYSHAKKNYQRHGERKPSRRRARWGHFRGFISPSARALNELGRCIYPCVDHGDYVEYTMEGRHA